MNKIWKKMICALLVPVFALCNLTAVSADEDLDALYQEMFGESSEQEQQSNINLTYECFAANDSGALYVNENSGRFYYEDNAGQKWYSNPDMGDVDESAGGVYRMELQSLLTLQYYDAKKNQLQKLNSEANSVRAGATTIKKNSDGITVTYDFPEKGFTVPLHLKLVEGGLEAIVDCKSVVEKNTDKYRIFTISILPYFGAGDIGEQGYILIADGSGCTMDFNNGAYSKLGYSSKIYGDDLSKTVVSKGKEKYPVMFPVFGIKKSLSALTAIIDEGAAYGTLHCYPNGTVTSYANVYASFSVRSVDSVIMNEESVSSTKSDLYENGKIKSRKFRMKYLFSLGENAGYNEMADVYRDYLIKTYNMKENGQEIGNTVFDFCGAVRRKKSVLGIPMKVNSPLSKISDIEAFCKKLFKNNISSVAISLRDWSKEQLSGKLDSDLKPVSCVGSQNELKALANLLNENGSTLSLSAQLQKFSRSGKGYTTMFDAAKSQSNAPIYIYSYYRSIFQKDKSVERMRLLCPEKIETITDNLLSGAKAYPDFVGLNLDKISGSLYADFSKKKKYDIGETKNAVSGSLSELKKRELALSFPADYSVGYCSRAEDIPSVSSQNVIFDRDVPFVQLVLSGLISYSSEPVNLAPDMNKAVLDCAAFGSALKFSLITEDAFSVVDTSKNELYHSNCNLLFKDIKKYSTVFANISSALGKSRMTSYEKQGEISVSFYTDGKKVIVDYGNKLISVMQSDKEIYRYVLKGE